MEGIRGEIGFLLYHAFLAFLSHQKRIKSRKSASPVSFPSSALAPKAAPPCPSAVCHGHRERGMKLEMMINLLLIPPVLITITMEN